ncbi:HAD family hydrolase [Henriciella barbarensis]|uniref:phosphoglycolate phosphatase n=1 Tax=Henriciella barbarensis TaxID=86342 RepID=A0A399QV82_9PROT|nr:HAD hydrolase-like protein [Henriciella barbarensis]RIJ22105.1 HAD family hydrolase [Henriciella barbarensis]
MTSDTLSGWTIVFDLDGTLVDTAPDLHIALNHCLSEAGFESVPFESIRHMIGQGAKAMIEKGLAFQGVSQATTEVEPLWQSFLDYYEANICSKSRPFKDATRSLEALTEMGATLAICTNKTQHLAETLIGKLGLTSHFASICGADSVPQKKPSGEHILYTVDRANGSPAKAIMIGDSQTDERAARNAGLPFVYVTFGYGPAPEQWDDTRCRASSYVEVMDAIQSVASP